MSESPTIEVTSRSEATLTLEPHDVWFLNAMLEEYWHKRQVCDAQESLGTTEYENDFIDDVATEFSRMMAQYEGKE